MNSPSDNVLAAEAACTVRPATAADRLAWQAFLQRSAAAVVGHRWEWEEIYAVYGLPVERWIALRDERLVGVVSLVCQRSMIFGRQLVSLPWLDAAGVLATDAAAEQALLEAVVRLAGSQYLDTVQLRQLQPLHCWQQPRTDKVLMELDLPATAEALWESFSPKVRNQVRKAEKSGLQYTRAEPVSLEELFKVYSRNMRDLGSPSHSFRLLRRVCDVFRDDAQVHLVRLDGRTIGAGLTLANGGALEIPWASSLRGYNSYCVNHLLYWNILRQACQAGFRTFRFGRSTTGSGTYQFKKQWGAQPVTLYWYTRDRAGKAVDGQQRPEEGFSLARRVWQRLPLPLARFLGPRVIARVA